MTPEWRLQFGYPKLSEPDPAEQTQTNTTTSKPPDYRAGKKAGHCREKAEEAEAGG